MQGALCKAYLFQESLESIWRSQLEEGARNTKPNDEIGRPKAKFARQPAQRRFAVVDENIQES